MIPSDILDEIISEYKKGLSLRNLARKYNYNWNSIYYHLNKIGIIRRIKSIKHIKNDDKLLIGAFLGFWAGDGSKFMDGWKYTIKLHFNKNNTKLFSFINILTLNLFDKKVRLITEKGTNKGVIRIYSKFVYKFIDDYLSYERNKTLTIRLKYNMSKYSYNFLRGFLLGLVLSDGYIKKQFKFTSISKKLINNLYFVLKKLKYQPKIHIYPLHSYEKYNCYNLTLNTEQTTKFKEFLNNIIIDCKLSSNIQDLKGYN